MDGIYYQAIGYVLIALLWAGAFMGMMQITRQLSGMFAAEFATVRQILRQSLRQVTAQLPLAARGSALVNTKTRLPSKQKCPA